MISSLYIHIYCSFKLVLSNFILNISSLNVHCPIFSIRKNACIPYITEKNIHMCKTFVIVHDIIHPSTSQNFCRNIGNYILPTFYIQSVLKCNPILSMILVLRDVKLITKTMSAKMFCMLPALLLTD